MSLSSLPPSPTQCQTHIGCRGNLLALLSFSCLFSQYPIIPGVYLTPPPPLRPTSSALCHLPFFSSLSFLPSLHFRSHFNLRRPSAAKQIFTRITTITAAFLHHMGRRLDPRSEPQLLQFSRKAAISRSVLFYVIYRSALS